MLDAVQHGVHARQVAIVFDGAVLGTRNVTIEVVEAWLARWSPPELGRKKLNCDAREPLFPIKVVSKPTPPPAGYWSGRVPTRTRRAVTSGQCWKDRQTDRDRDHPRPRGARSRAGRDDRAAEADDRAV